MRRVAFEDPTHKPVTGGAAVGEADDGHDEALTVLDSKVFDCNDGSPHPLLRYVLRPVTIHKHKT